VAERVVLFQSTVSCGTSTNVAAPPFVRGEFRPQTPKDIQLLYREKVDCIRRRHRVDRLGFSAVTRVSANAC